MIFKSNEKKIASDLWYYDLILNKWDQIKNFDFKGRRLPGSILYEDRWYILGGDTTDACSGDKKFFYINMKNYSVKELDDLPFDNVCQSMCEINGKIYSYGGISGMQVNDLHCYDIHLNKWSELKPNTIRLSSFACVAWKDLMIVFGGYDGQEYQKDIWIYNTKENSWECMLIEGEKPKNSCYPGGIMHRGELYIFGGYSGSHTIKEMYSLKFEDKKWKLFEKVENSILQNTKFYFK